MKFLIACLIFLCWEVNAATYYVATNGVDSGPGTIGSPWATLYYATRGRGSYLLPGDTVYLRGGRYSGNSHAIDLGTGLGNSGSNGAPIVISSYPNEFALISDITLPYRGAIIKDKSFWQFKSIMWSNTYGSAFLENVTNFLYTNCVFTQMLPTATNGDYQYGNLSFAGTHPSNAVINCTFTNWGVMYTNVDSANQYKIAGVGISIGMESLDTPCFYNLVQGCYFANEGHDHFQLNTAFTIVRSNIFHNEPWYPTNEISGPLIYNFGNPRFAKNPFQKWGARNTKPGDGSSGPIGQVDWRNVFEDNVFYYASPPPDSNGAFDVELTTNQSIYRRNRFCFAVAAGVYLNINGGSSYCRSNAIYGNVFYGNGTSWQYAIESLTNYSWGLNINTFLNQVTNNFIVNNILLNNSPTNVNPEVRYRNYYRTNFDGIDPKFVSTNGMGFVWDAGNLPDFHLQVGSVAIDAGAWLAFAVGSGSGTTLILDNSLYFSDGNHAVPGDTIQLQGQTNLAVVLVNDFTNNTLYLDRSLTWTNGQGVSLPYNGNAPDMGAFESGLAGGATPVIDVNPVSQKVQAGGTLTFTGSASGTPPVTLQWKLNGSDIVGAVSSIYTTGTLGASDNGGQYTLVASSPYGSATSTAATATVISPSAKLGSGTLGNGTF